MIEIVKGTLCDDFREYRARYSTGRPLPWGDGVIREGWTPRVVAFKVGEGGWEWDKSGKKRRRAPSSSLRSEGGRKLQDLDAAVDGSREPEHRRYPFDGRFVYQKSLNPVFESDFHPPGDVVYHCRLEGAECNDDGFGNPPELWEIGLFCEHPVFEGELMQMVYATLPRVVKLEGTEAAIRVRVAD